MNRHPATFEWDVLRQTRLLLAAGCLCLLAAQGVMADGSEWTVPRVLQILKAREDAIHSVVMSVQVSEPIPEGHRQRYEANIASTKLVAEAVGVTLPPWDAYEKHNWRAGEPYLVRYYRDNQGRERQERYKRPAPGGSAGELTISYVNDGKVWWTIQNNGQASIDDGKLLPRAEKYLGLEFDWRDPQFTSPRGGSLWGTLRQAQEAGRLSLASATDVPAIKPGQVGLVSRRSAHRPGTPAGIALFDEGKFLFDPALGMCPVRAEYRTVERVGDQYEPPFPPSWSVVTWDGYKEVADGIWLPTAVSWTQYDSVRFPKSGDKYAPGFNPDKAKPSEYRYESFAVAETKCRVTKVEINKTIDPDLFQPKLPPDTMVYDAINEKTYQASGLSPATLDEMRASLPDPRDTHGPGFWVMLIGANAALVIVLFLGLKYWRGRGRKTGPSSPP